MLEQLNSFQNESRATAANYSPLDAISIYGLGVSSEGGEVGDLYKKVIGHGHNLKDSEIKKEAGDCLWYASRVCDFLQIGLGDVWQNANLLDIDKIKAHGESQFTVLEHATLDCLSVMGRGSGMLLLRARDLNRARGVYHSDDLELGEIAYKEMIASDLNGFISGLKSLLKLYNIDVLEVLEINQLKLNTRFKDGFSTEASVNRVDTKKGGLVDGYEGQAKEDTLCPKCKTHKLFIAEVKNKNYVLCSGYDCSYVKALDICPNCDKPITSGESCVFGECFNCACNKPSVNDDNEIFNQVLNLALNSNMTPKQYEELKTLICGKMDLSGVGKERYFCKACRIAFTKDKLTYTNHTHGDGWYCKACLLKDDDDQFCNGCNYLFSASELKFYEDTTESGMYCKGCMGAFNNE